MALANYAELKASIVERTGRDDIDSQLDDFIKLTEQEIFNNLRVREMQGRASLTSSTRFLTLPSDYQEARRLTPLYQGNYYKSLKAKVPGSVIALDEVSEGIPREYCITDSIELNCIPLGSVEMHYYKKLTGLSNSNTTNAILTSFPSIYLYGCIAEAYSFSEETEEEQKFRGKFYGAIETANNAAKMSMGAAPVVQVEGVTP